MGMFGIGLEPGMYAEPEAIGPLPMAEPEAIAEPLAMPEPEAMAEPLIIPEPEPIAEPEAIPEPEAIAEPEAMPEALPIPLKPNEDKLIDADISLNFFK